jgi:hypothetical protein
VTAALLLVVAGIAIGTFAVRAVVPDADRTLIWGGAFPVGVSIPAFVLLAASLAGADWSRGLLIASFALATIALAAAARLRGRGASERRSGLTASWIDAGSLIVLGGYAVYATAGPMAEFDFLAMWGMKGKEFFLSRGIDFAWLAHPWNQYTHPDYPILLTLIYDELALLQGSWDDRWIGVLFVAFAGSVLLILRGVLERESGSKHLAALGTLGLVPFAASPYLGMAEGPLIAFGTSGVILVREGLRRGQSSLVTLGAVFLGLAANTKNEGLTLCLAVAFGLLVSGEGRRLVWRLWPAVVLIAPWLVLRSIHGLQTDLMGGSVLERVVSHLREPALFLESMSRYPLGKPLFWTGVAIAVVLLLGRLVRRDRFLLTVLVVQFGFFMAAYLASPHSIDWHFRYSWERVLSQLTLMLAFVVVSNLIAAIRGSVREGEHIPDAAG